MNHQQTVEELLRARTRLFWVIIAGSLISVLLLSALLFVTARIAKQNQLIAKKSQQYITCLAKTFVGAQEKKITDLDIDHCNVRYEGDTQPSTTPTNPVVPGAPQTEESTSQGDNEASRPLRTNPTASQNNTPSPPESSLLKSVLDLVGL